MSFVRIRCRPLDAFVSGYEREALFVYTPDELSLDIVLDVPSYEKCWVTEAHTSTTAPLTEVDPLDKGR
jgi:hypothetical protein